MIFPPDDAFNGCLLFLFGFVFERGFTNEQKMTDTQQLLAEYAANGSEAAFRELVARYINFVYSVALRLVDGDSQLAEDVTQTVFIALAKDGRTLSREVMLGGWLHQQTYHLATRAVRGERRRQFREREAVEMNMLQDDSRANWRQVAPILDEAITQLSSEDRTAILLRFFEQHDFRSVGDALGATEDAARMRVNRALEKLHSLLTRRGVTLSLAALGTVLTAKAITAAPAGLAAAMSSVALASAVAGTGTTLPFLKAITMTKSQVGIIGAILAASLLTLLVVQHRAQVKPREENLPLRLQPAAAGESNMATLPPIEVAPAIPSSSVSVETNAADFYRQAFTLYDALSENEKKVLGNSKAALVADQVAQLCEKVAPILDLMHQATAQTNCDWQLGPMTTENNSDFLKYYDWCRGLARTSIWRATHCGADNSPRVTDDLLANLQLAHRVPPSALLGFLVNTAIQGQVTDFIAKHASTFTRPEADRLLQALNDPVYEEDFFRAIEQEADFGSHAVEKDIPALTKDAPNPGDRDRAASMLRQVPEMEREYAGVLTQTESQYQLWLGRMQAAQASNPLLKMMWPAFENAVDKARATVVQHVMVSAGLTVLQSGPESLSTYPDPATGQPFQYQQTADGFQLQSVYERKGQPITMVFRHAD